MVYLTMHVCKDTAQKKIKCESEFTQTNKKNNSLKQDDF